MPQLIEVRAEGGSVIFATPQPGDSIQAVGFMDETTKKVETALDDVVAMAQRMSRSFQDLVKGAVTRSEVEFGLSLTGKGNVYVVAMETQAALKVRLVFESQSRRAV
jgi:hypothetical protein